MTGDRDEPACPTAPEDVGAAGHLPCCLAPSMAELLAPWIGQLPGEAAADLADLANVMQICSRRIAINTARELPHDDDALIAALTLRLWSLGVADTTARLTTELQRHAAQVDAATHDAAAQQLGRRYATDPARIRRDGIDLVAGSLLTP